MLQRLRARLARHLLKFPNDMVSDHVEERLVDRRCRCGKYARELHRECAWHDATSAQYAAELEGVVRRLALL